MRVHFYFHILLLTSIPPRYKWVSATELGHDNDDEKKYSFIFKFHGKQVIFKRLRYESLDYSTDTDIDVPFDTDVSHGTVPYDDAFAAWDAAVASCVAVSCDDEARSRGYDA